MSGGISIKGMTPEWQAREGEKSNKMLRAWMLEEQGEADRAMTLFAEVAEEEEQIRDYCHSLGLFDKAYINAVSAAGCWARAGDLYRALQGYDALLNDPTLTPRMRNRVCELADKLRERRRQWSAFRRQLQAQEEHNDSEIARVTEPVAA